MDHPPTIPEIAGWLRKRNPLGIFSRGDLSVQDIDPKPWSGHFNYLVTIQGRRFALRFKGPEWGDPAEGIVDEYNTLRFVEEYAVGPRAYYLAEDFFGEPMLLEEFLEGVRFDALPAAEQAVLLPEAAGFIARLNKIPVGRERLHFNHDLSSYDRSRNNWRERLARILGYAETRPWGEKIERLMPKAEAMLGDFEPRLKRVLAKHGPAFVFVSAHAGHLLRAADGFRFLNWEAVGFGDWGYALAVFLASLSRRPGFAKIKERMVHAYREANPSIAEFGELVEQRLDEREVSNLLWALATYVRAAEAGMGAALPDFSGRYQRVVRVLERWRRSLAQAGAFVF